MKVKHSLEKYKQKIEKDVQSASFFLTNKSEGFSWIDSSTFSRYQGVFFSEDNKIFRVIESINPNCQTSKLVNKFYLIERNSKDNKEIFFMPDFLNALVYESEKESEIVLDFKEAYANDYANYDLIKSDNHIIVNINYRGELFYLIITYKGDYLENRNYVYRNYQYDLSRNSHPSERNVISIGKIKSKKIVFFLSKDKHYALDKSKDLFENSSEYKNEKKKRINKFLKSYNDQKISLAYNSSKASLDGLTTSKGLLAGYPWFFQYWARDELISLGGLYKVDKEISKEIELKWLNALKENWTNFPAKYKVDSSPEGLSLDSPGWVLKRLELFPELLKSHREQLKNFLTFQDFSFIDIKTNTWMDSIERIKPIEIQVMKLYALRLLANMNSPRLSENEEILKNKIINTFLKDNYLYDSEDKKIRPNIFIAYYFFPSLLTKSEWEICFDNALKELWLDWGGLSTISKNDPLYHKDYTGESPGSYHNGDSWFWINNLAALVLHDLNKDKYSSYINKIIEASTEEILFMNAVGHHAELSSASNLKSEGSPYQAFSEAMYIELIDKMFS